MKVKKTSSLTNYLRIAFSCYLFVLGSFARFFLVFLAMVLISRSVFSLCTIF